VSKKSLNVKKVKPGKKMYVTVVF